MTDEHGTDWGHPEGKGRTGLWVAEHTRAGVKAAMLARRFFATRTSGLRVDATAAVARGEPVPMGSVLPTGRGDVTFTLDLERDDVVGRAGRSRCRCCAPVATCRTVPLVARVRRRRRGRP